MSKRLKDRMVEEMDLRGLDEKTKKAYLQSMLMFISFYKKPPARLDVKDIKKYQLYLLKERELAPNSVNRHLSPYQFKSRNSAAK